jgi:hypothetical protein
MRYYELKGAGRLIEITEGEYEFLLRKAVIPEYHEMLKQPLQGFNYLGVAYIALEGTPSYQ